MTLCMKWCVTGVVLVDFEAAALAVKDFMCALLHNMLFEAPESFGRGRGALQRAAENFGALARFDVTEAVL